MDKPLKSVMHDEVRATLDLRLPPQPQASPPLDWYQIIYCLETEEHVCEQLAQGCYMKARGQESNSRPSESQVQRPNYYTTRKDTVGDYVLYKFMFCITLRLVHDTWTEVNFSSQTPV